MAATFQKITRSQIMEALGAMGGKLKPEGDGWVRSNKVAKEYVYDMKLKAYPGVVVRVYTSIDIHTNLARHSGSDAIRVCAVDLSHVNSNGIKGRGVIKTKRVHRTQNWAKNLTKRVLATVKHGKEVMAKREAQGQYKRKSVDTMSTATKCPKCKGTGTYLWGACVNGVMQHSGQCFACGGKGHQTPEDVKRNDTYWNHVDALAPSDIPEDDGELDAHELADLDDMTRGF